jgi:hypothetical protein
MILKYQQNYVQTFACIKPTVSIENVSYNAELISILKLKQRAGCHLI